MESPKYRCLFLYPNYIKNNKLGEYFLGFKDQLKWRYEMEARTIEEDGNFYYSLRLYYYFNEEDLESNLTNETNYRFVVYLYIPKKSDNYALENAGKKANEKFRRYVFDLHNRNMFFFFFSEARFISFFGFKQKKFKKTFQNIRLLWGRKILPLSIFLPEKMTQRESGSK